MMPLTYVELFAGAGGLSRGLEMAGWECVAHAEWDAHARAVLRRHWPNTPLFGDVSTLTGQMIAEASGGRPVTMLTGGSPCQDLSIAGKRAGMTEDSGTRSSLYFEQVRLWHELNAISPCPYLLWENVLGAFSSNNGRDFAAVLSALVGTPVAVPEDGWKGGGGVVSGCTGVAAWRVLDCQFFGPPQRRRRVFVLGVRAGGADPAEILSLLESLSGHLESGSTARQDTAPDARSGVASGGDSIRLFDSFNQKADKVAATLSDGESGRPIAFTDPAVFAVRTAQTSANGHGVAADITHTLDGANGQAVVSFAQNASGELRVGEVAGTLGTNSNASGRSTPMISGVSPIDTRNATRTTQGDQAAHVLAFHATQDPISGAVAPSDGATAQCGIASVYDARGNGDGNVVSTLPGDHLNRITDYTPVVIPILEANARQGLSKEGSVGIGKDGDPMFTLQATVQNGVFVIDKHSGQPELGTVALTLKTDLAHDMGPVVTVTIPQSFGNGQLGHNKDELVILSSTQGNASVSDGIAPTLDVMHDRPVLFSGAAAVNISGGTAQLQSTMGTLGARSGGSEVGAQTRGVVVAPTLNTTQFAKHTGSNQNVGELSQLLPATVRPRRLMPIECERLMGWPDRWTERGIDEQGRDYAVSDSARYKLCGNGVASPVAGWIGWRLRDTLEAIL
ncbi:DNA (cytosine-5-)-methyltransferase [bacterium]|nr:DNA (cytosine-5-)-methyltransferase [bacterium]